MVSSGRTKGFTLIELLIVTVVIAILATISIVAYSNVQQRSRDSAAANAASQLSTKIEVWNSQLGHYPSNSDVTGGLINAKAAGAELGLELRNKVITTGVGNITNNKPINYKACGTSPNFTGAEITYKKSNFSEVIRRGKGC